MSEFYLTIMKIMNFNPNKSFALPRHLKSRVPPPLSCLHLLPTLLFLANALPLVEWYHGHSWHGFAASPFVQMRNRSCGTWMASSELNGAAREAPTYMEALSTFCTVPAMFGGRWHVLVPPRMLEWALYIITRIWRESPEGSCRFCLKVCQVVCFWQWCLEWLKVKSKKKTGLWEMKWYKSYHRVDVCSVSNIEAVC